MTWCSVELHRYGGHPAAIHGPRAERNEDDKTGYHTAQQHLDSRASTNLIF